MDLVVIPHALLIFYGGVVLASGSILGFILGRNRRRKLPSPESPDLLARRVTILERELEEAQRELNQLSEERAFHRELLSPREDKPRLGSDRRRLRAS
jgi:hypothetical protein